eukprot:TRINITY_DN110704_c0_g1_i1.p1 TRINITY_DN110704_c0_g1~~TRINITY_DN110704_c0_g1_i1.p1  ORF type:complete len:441 (-),score=93.35 TRINITY_DN110704_c0_g1_i1:68-1390(-)
MFDVKAVPITPASTPAIEEDVNLYGGTASAEDELRDAMTESLMPSAAGTAAYDDQESEVVFCPRSLRATMPMAAVVHDTFSAEDADATQRRCWVLPPSEGQALDAAPEQSGDRSQEEKVEQAISTSRSDPAPVSGASIGAAPSRPARAERPFHSDRAAARRTASASERNRRTGMSHGPGQRGTATMGSLSRQQDAAPDPPLSARRRPAHAAATGRLAATSAGRTGGSEKAVPTRRVRERSQDVVAHEAPTPNGVAEPMVPVSQLRRIEAQLATFRTRNGALEGEVAGLRSEAEAVRQRYEEELERLRRESRSKDKELQARDQELLKLQTETQELSKTLRDIMESMSDGSPIRVIGASSQIAQPVQAHMAASGGTAAAPRIGQALSAGASPNMQLRQPRGEAVVWSYPSNGVQPSQLVAQTPPRQRSLQAPVRQVLPFPSH